MEKTAKWVERKLSELGILDRYTWVILCGMILADGTYWEAVAAWAEVVGSSKEWFNSHCCYRILESEIEGHPKDIFESLAEEYRRNDNENGVPI